MSQSVISEIERRIFALPKADQHRLISRVFETLRNREQLENDFDVRLIEMANDPEIQRELKEIEQDFRITEFDGLAG